jgi:hypothetical protein
MKTDVRACVAYIAGRLISKKKALTLYDVSRSKHLVFSGSVSARKFDIHDYARDCQMSGRGSRSSYRLYDQGEAQHLDLIIDGQKFDGYDYGSICHFTGTVNGSIISLFDYGARRNFTYRF